jgi:hypothetical protein
MGRGGDSSKGTIVFWQRPKVLSEDGPDGWVHASMPRDFVDRLHEAVSKAQVSSMEAFSCVHSVAEHSSGDNPYLDPRTGAHHLVVQRNSHHLQRVLHAIR